MEEECVERKGCQVWGCVLAGTAARPGSLQITALVQVTVIPSKRSLSSLFLSTLSFTSFQRDFSATQIAMILSSSHLPMAPHRPPGAVKLSWCLKLSMIRLCSLLWVYLILLPIHSVSNNIQLFVVSKTPLLDSITLCCDFYADFLSLFHLTKQISSHFIPFPPWYD